MHIRLKSGKMLLIGILIICILTSCKIFLREKNIEKNKVVLYFNETDEIEKKLKKENCIIIKDCRESIIDYDSQEKTILFINHKNELSEESLLNKELSIINIPGLKENIRNAQYGPGKNEISYIREGKIYIYDTKKDFEREITDCLYSSWMNTYAWKDEDTLFTIKPVGEYGMRKLFIWSRDKYEESIVDTDAIRCFTLSKEKNKIYAIIEYSRFNGITVEALYDLIEIDLKNNCSKKLTDIDTEINLLLECIDDKYLFYVEEHLDKKISNVYCYSIESGKKRCIYKTNQKIIGVIKQ